MVGGVGAGPVPALGLMVGYFRANHAAGVSSRTRFAGKFSRPGEYGVEIFAVETVSDRICYRPSKMISGEFDRIIDRVFLPLIGK